MEIEEAILGITDLIAIVVTHKWNTNLLSKYDAVIFMKDVTITENGPFTQEVVNTFNHFKKEKAYPNEKLTKELI